MKVEFIKKEKKPSVTFGELKCGDVFAFTGEQNNGSIYMKIPGEAAFKISNTNDTLPVNSQTVIEYYESTLVIKGN